MSESGDMDQETDHCITSNVAKQIARLSALNKARTAKKHAQKQTRKKINDKRKGIKRHRNDSEKEQVCKVKNGEE